MKDERFRRGVGRQPITQALYDALVVAFREVPGKYLTAARKVGCDDRTAKRGWHRGWKTKTIDGPPIKIVLEQEQEAARFERQRAFDTRKQAAEEQRDTTIKDAIRTRTGEAQAAEASRANATGVALIINRLLGPTAALADLLAVEYKKIADSGQIDVAIVAALVRQMATLTLRGNEAIKMALEIERLRMGDPNQVLNAARELETVTPEEAAQELERIMRTLQRARETGTIEAALEPAPGRGNGGTPPPTIQ